MRDDLGHSYRSYFAIGPAVDETSTNDAFYIRHDVYARELGFEPTRADQRETDKYDERSIHCVLRTSAMPSKLVGCARVVFAAKDDPAALLPFEVTCRAVLHRHVVDPESLPRDKIGEVSRLAVLSEFRRRKGESGVAAKIDGGDFGNDQQPRFPFIPVSLYMGAVMLAERQGIEYLFTLTEPRLAEHFAKLGVHITQIGDPIEHRGQRVPSMLTVHGMYENLRPLIKPLWHAIREQMNPV
jgi:N-acyl amino acid synthase of PEP-CTERM/exosortase system